MNKYLILLIISSFSALAGGDNGTGEPNSNNNSNSAELQLVCSPITEIDVNSEQYSYNCIVTEIPLED